MFDVSKPDLSPFVAIMRRFPFLFALVLAGLPSLISGQDVEMLGARYGTPVPEGYRRSMLGAGNAAFEFRRGWSARLAEASGRNFDGRDLPAFRDGPQLLGPRQSTVEGTFRIPVLLGLYANSDPFPPYGRDTIQTAYFGVHDGTITDYYDEVSGGRVSLQGEVIDWVTVPRADTSYTVNESGLVTGVLGGEGVGNFIWDLLVLNDVVDWSPYDNDGPDGLPNSGDDDGYVDVLAVIHPTRGGECGGSGSTDRIWSHRWSLSSAVFSEFETNTPSANGGVIRVDDYTIQPAVACSGGDLAQIGVFTHELGHAFGLPDLYDTEGFNGTHSGVGTWDLMGSGSWGCGNQTPEKPCHMGAWSKAALGWVDVVTLSPDTDHGSLQLGPVQTDGTVYRVDATDGSGEYFLIENRQAFGYDQTVWDEGLLVWQVDEDWVLARWAENRVNAQPHMGVWLRQADGDDDLGRGRGRGDGGDPFPGQTGNTVFHAASIPSPISYLGGFAGLTMFDIVRTGDDVSFRLLTRQTTVVLTAQGAASEAGLFLVNGRTVDPPATTFLSAPFTTWTVEAAEGEVIRPGQRRPFLGWREEPAEGRTRRIVTPVADTTYIAEYGSIEYLLDVTLTGSVNGIVPADLVTDPADEDFWFAPGAAVALTAQPKTGFGFLRWTDDLAGQPNPATISMTAPVTASADFELIYAIAAQPIALPAATALDVQLVVENGTAPIVWSLVSGILPEGVLFDASGRFQGASLENGSFALTVTATDALGLPAQADIVLDLNRPSLSIGELTSQFLLVGPRLTDVQKDYLDREGNNRGPYDLGDFRAWALSDPALPLSVGPETVVRREIVIGVLARDPELGR